MAIPDKVVVGELRGGRNGIDSPLSTDFPMDQCVEAQNILWGDGPLGNRRGGSDAVSTTGGTAFTVNIRTLIRHMSDGNEGNAELWGIDGAATPIVKRLVNGTTWANVTLSEAISTLPQDVVGVSFNGKLFLFYDSTVDRLHVWDPNLATPQVRRVGINQGSSAPTVADLGGGTYPAVLRYYRVRFLQVSGTTTWRKSEATPSVSFTPSGTGNSARVTRPTAPSEQETHWIVEASTDNTDFYNISGNILIATTTYDDAALVATYVNNPLSEVAGTFTRPTSGKFGVTDGNRLIFAGTYESGTTQGSRVWFTPVLSSLDRGDDERLNDTTSLNPYLDLNEKDGGDITGLAYPVNGVVYAFKYRQIWRLTPTGDSTTPYLARKISNVIGCIRHQTIVMAEDAFGNPAVYFLSHKGPYRLSVNGLEYLGRDIEDQWYGLNTLSAVNLGATTVVGHGIYHVDKDTIVWWIATGASNTPNQIIALNIKRATRGDRYGVRGGWSRWTGDITAALTSTMFANTLGTTMSRDLKPYIGLNASATVLKLDVTATLTDNGTLYQAYIKTRSLLSEAELGQNLSAFEPHLEAKAQAGTLTLTYDRDFGAETTTATVSLAALGTETRILKKIEGAQIADAGVIQAQIGDGAAQSIAAWTLDALSIPLTVGRRR